MGEVLKEGMAAPKFSLASSSGDEVRLADYAGKSRVVLYFYPRRYAGVYEGGLRVSRCAGGVQEAVGAGVRGEPDPVEDVTKFAKKFELNFPLLADADHAVCEKYGVWQEKSMYGKKYWGAMRTTFVIGKDGKIEKVFEKVKPEGHDREVLEYLKSAK